MNHKKIFFSIAFAAVVAIFVTTNLVSAANLNQAANTLPANDEWAIMAHAAMNQNVGQSFLRGSIIDNVATDYEKRILAITAIGENPRTFTQQDLISKLETFFDGNQIGDPTLLNDDIFGVLALTSAGISDNAVAKTRQFILSHQNSDGGWGFGVGIGSDSNSTAMAAAALAQTGGAPNSAFEYLARCQDSSGGYGFTPTTPADGASTAWVIIGLNSANRNVPANAKSFLDNLQTSDGSFKWKPTDNSGSSLVTAYAVIALSAHSIPLRIQPTQIPTPPAPTPTPSPAPTPTPPTPNPIPLPTPNTVQLCIDINFSGGCESFTANDANLLDNLIRNDNASSVIIPPGMRAALFEHINFNGKCEEFSANDADLRDNAIGNDQVSSIAINQSCPKIIPTPPPLPTPTLPTPTPTPTPGIHVTITYPGNKIFVGDVSYFQNETALQAFETAAHQINLLYEIKQTSFGPFVASIDGYQAFGINGWQYAVNNTVPDAAASNYILHDRDRIQWFYGSPQSAPF